VNWQEFELNASKYLNEFCASPGSGISFEVHGGTDSSVADISVRKDKKHQFYIECKLGTSQAGQFVVLNSTTTRTFSASPRNKGKEQRWNEIIDHMNDDYEYYSVSRNVPMRCETAMMIRSIREHYIEKGVKFLIASNRACDFPKNLIKVIDIETFDADFEVSGVYRRKKSGSRHLPMKDREHFERIAREEFENPKIVHEDRKTFVTIDEDPMDLHVDGRYYLSEQGEGTYIVKKLSGTNNRNVIFTLRFAPADGNYGLDGLRREIDKLD